MKKCSKCGEEKPLSEFYKNVDARDGFRKDCKVCASLVRKKYYQDNREARREYWKKNYQANREFRKRYYQENKRYFIILAKLRKRQVRHQMPKWLTFEQRREIELIYEHARECEALTGDQYVVDHIVPLRGKNVCGLHVPWNLQVLPSDINDSKGNKLIEELAVAHG